VGNLEGGLPASASQRLSFRGEGSAAIPLGGEPSPTPEDPYSWHRNGLPRTPALSLSRPVYSPCESLANVDAATGNAPGRRRTGVAALRPCGDESRSRLGARRLCSRT
jgi:hypothetical protein